MKFTLQYNLGCFLEFSFCQGVHVLTLLVLTLYILSRRKCSWNSFHICKGLAFYFICFQIKMFNYVIRKNIIIVLPIYQFWIED